MDPLIDKSASQAEPQDVSHLDKNESTGGKRPATTGDFAVWTTSLPQLVTPTDPVFDPRAATSQRHPSRRPKVMDKESTNQATAG